MYYFLDIVFIKGYENLFLNFFFCVIIWDSN